MEYKDFNGKQVRILLVKTMESVVGKIIDTHNRITVQKSNGKNAIVEFKTIALVEEV